jgi:GNAT superfamily N-acetyltransferase
VIGNEIRGWRAREPGDHPALTWSTWLDAYGSFIPEQDLKTYFDTVYTVEELSKLQASRYFHGLLAEVKGVSAGYAKVRYAPEEKRCYVSSLYVLPAYQGKGLGRMLLAEAETHALAFGGEGNLAGRDGAECPGIGVVSTEWFCVCRGTAVHDGRDHGDASYRVSPNSSMN